jgi:hypothetical protein
MDNPEKLAILVTQDTRRSQTKHITQNTKSYTHRRQKGKKKNIILKIKSHTCTSTNDGFI